MAFDFVEDWSFKINAQIFTNGFMNNAIYVEIYNKLCFINSYIW